MTVTGAPATLPAMEQHAEPPQRLVDEACDNGLRYTEERAAAKRGFPVRRYALLMHRLRSRSWGA